MKIEIGKFYKTRVGAKARIYAVDACEDYPIQGAILSLDGWGMQGWTSLGSVSSECDHANDLMSEWVEVKPRMLAWIGKSGRLYFKPEYGSYKDPSNLWVRAPWLDEPESKS